MVDCIEMAYQIVLATSEDKDAVLCLYQAQKERPFCFWNEDYPSMVTIEDDLSRDALFVMKDENGEIIAAISIEKDEAVDALTCWSPSLQPGGEYARLAVKPAFQNRGLARQMVSHVLGILRNQGCKSAHILVNVDNVPAIRTYAHFRFHVAGTCEMYNQHLLCYEIELD